MITLITGTPGSGKTLFAVTKILEYVEQNKKLLEQGKEPRLIYSDIDGLNIPGVEPAPSDWRDTPDGSVIFYDEIQQREEYKKSRYDNPICDALQVHRHTGHDIYGITQFPVLLHPNFRAVVGMHHHLHRGWGLSSATVFNWAYCVDAPNAPSNKKLAEHTFRFTYPKHVYKYYKSATIHTHKSRIPKRIFLGLAVLIAVGYFAFNMLFSEDNFFKKIYGFDQDKPAKVDGATSPNILSIDSNNHDAQVQQEGDVSTLPSAENRRIYILQKLEQKYLNPYTIEVAEFDTVRPALVAQMGGVCRAYNQFGDILNIDDVLCKSMLKEVGMKPRARRVFNDYHAEQSAPPATIEQAPPDAPQTLPQPQKINPLPSSEFIFESANNALAPAKPTEVVPAVPKAL